MEANRQELQPGHPPAGFDRTLGGVLSPDGEYMAVSATVARRGDHFLSRAEQAYTAIKGMNESNRIYSSNRHVASVGLSAERR